MAPFTEAAPTGGGHFDAARRADLSCENLAATLGMTDVARPLLANLMLNFSSGPAGQRNWAQSPQKSF